MFWSVTCASPIFRPLRLNPESVAPFAVAQVLSHPATMLLLLKLFVWPWWKVWK